MIDNQAKESGWTNRTVSGLVAEKTGMPILAEKLELKIGAIHRRENLLMNCVAQQSDDDLIACSVSMARNKVSQ